jgi:hypothetical protein
VRQSSLGYLGLRGEGSIPVPLPPPPYRGGLLSNPVAREYQVRARAKWHLLDEFLQSPGCRRRRCRETSRSARPSSRHAGLPRHDRASRRRTRESVRSPLCGLAGGSQECLRCNSRSIGPTTTIDNQVRTHSLVDEQQASGRPMQAKPLRNGSGKASCRSRVLSGRVGLRPKRAPESRQPRVSNPHLTVLTR